MLPAAAAQHYFSNVHQIVIYSDSLTAMFNYSIKLKHGIYIQNTLVRYFFLFSAHFLNL